MVKDAASIVLASTAASAFIMLLIYKSMCAVPDNNTFEGNVMAFVFFSFIPFILYVDSPNTVPIDKYTYVAILSAAALLILLFLFILLKSGSFFKYYFNLKMVTLIIYGATIIGVGIHVHYMKKVELVTWFNYIRIHWYTQ